VLVVHAQGRVDVIAVELVKQTRRARGWVVLGVLTATAVLLTVLIGVSYPTLAERIGDRGSVVTNTSGFTLPLIALTAMMLFLLPLAVAVFAGETVAGERAWGSLRYLLVRPVTRGRVLGAKLAVAAMFSVAAVVITTVSALVAGTLAFGWRPLTVLDLTNTTPFHFASATFSPLDALARLLLASVFVTVALSSTFSFALLLSTVTSRPFTAVAGGVGLGLFSRALDNVPGLHALSSWLPMTNDGTNLWTGLFTRPVDAAGFAHFVLVQALYSAAFLVAAWAWFTRSDALE
jgi:ABC-2 type transport system permease protein